jgi:hypothetical protein
MEFILLRTSLQRQTQPQIRSRGLAGTRIANRKEREESIIQAGL